MSRKKETIPQYGTINLNGIIYYRARITDADGKRHSLYAETPELLYEKVTEAKREVAEIKFRRENPTVREYCEKWLLMQSAVIRDTTQDSYRRTMQKYIVDKIGDMYLDEVTPDDLKLLMVPVSKMSSALYANVNMLVKCIFYSAERNRLVEHNPATQISAKGGKPKQPREALSDEQKNILLDTVRGLPPYLFVMIGLYSGLRREEILGLQWDCVFLDAKAPYIAVRRAWHVDHNRPVVDTKLKTKAAKRDVPIPRCLVQCLRAEKNVSSSQYVISDSHGEPLAATQFARLWRYITVRSTGMRKYYRYINGEKIEKEIHPILGGHANNNPNLIYTMDFHVTPHMLRHTYITDLIYAGVDPKTVQYLAGHENSKTTMDIYCKLRYNKPEDLRPIVNHAFSSDMRG